MVAGFIDEELETLINSLKKKMVAGFSEEELQIQIKSLKGMMFAGFIDEEHEILIKYLKTKLVAGLIDEELEMLIKSLKRKMVPGFIDEEFEIQIPAPRLWRAGICDCHNLLPGLLGDRIKSVEILEGDGGVGTIKKFNFTEAFDFKYVKVRVDVLNHEKFEFKYSMIEGGRIGTRFNSMIFGGKFHEMERGTSVCKVHIDFDAIGELPNEAELNEMKESFVRLIKAVEKYLRAKPDAYA